MSNVSTPEQQRRSSLKWLWLLLLLLVPVVVLVACLAALFVLPFNPDSGGGGPASKTQFEISTLATAIENFKKTYNVDYIPSQIKLCEFYGDYKSNDQLDKDTVKYLLMLWPNMMTPDPNDPEHQPVWRLRGIDWNGNGKTENGSVILEGDQCLVFFLGGIPDQGPVPGVLGFTQSDRDPADLNQRGNRKGPFFEFQTHRLIKRLNTAGGKALFYSYADACSKNQPYVYFSNYGTRNGYNSPLTKKYPTPDSSLGVEPYYEKKELPLFLNPSLYQIISAGADGVFGPGGQWTPATASQIAPAGRDDHSNFTNGARLGDANQ
jgi:hypothetical protein